MHIIQKLRKCYIDCYKLDVRQLWRLDMGVKIRAGAHYTQFMVYDFNNDGKDEICVKTAPGTKMIIYNDDNSIKSEKYITMLKSDIGKGYSNEDNYVCSSEDYYNHLVKIFMAWSERREVKSKEWYDTLEECFGIEKKYDYPLNEESARELVDYFISVYAKNRSP